MDLKEELHDFLIWLDIDNDVHEVHNLSIKEIVDEYLSSLPEAEKGVTNEEVTIKAVAKEKNPYSKECPNRHLWEEGFINGYNFGIDVKSFLAQSDQIKEAESPVSGMPTDEIIANRAMSRPQGGLTDSEHCLVIQGFIEGAKWFRSRLAGSETNKTE